MSGDPRIPAPIESLIRVVAGGSGDEGDRRASTFARGLALGALVGAAIAGSTIWQRRRAVAGVGRSEPGARRPAPEDPEGHWPTSADTPMQHL